MNKKPTAEESKIAFSELTKKFYIVHKDGSKKDVTEWFDKHANNAVEETYQKCWDKWQEMEDDASFAKWLYNMAKYYPSPNLTNKD